MGPKDNYEDRTTKAEWEHGRRYILDPLTAPEPSQETGPGSSFISPVRRSLSTKARIEEPKKRSTPNSYPTPPASASPTRSSFQPTSPTRDSHRYSILSGDRQAVSSLGRSNSVNDRPAHPHYPSSVGLNRRKTVHTANPPPTKWNEGTILSRSSSNAMRGPAAPSSPPPDTDPDKGKGLRRASSLSGRYPHDMSHRPLDMVKRDIRAADRVPHLRSRKIQVGLTDTIDSLDVTGYGGVAYHHSGPYDATLAARNTNRLYSPVEAVKSSNNEALKATPREYIQDSLVKHVPLQGTATIPPGMPDFGGKPMRYEEGADLMRDADAPGGPYKRWDCIPYQPDDLKGKGEPSYTIEKQQKEQQARLLKHSIGNGTGGMDFEMQPGIHSHQRKNSGVKIRQRSVSNAGESSSRPGPATPTSPASNALSTNSDIRRSNTTGKRFSDGLKRRFGSLRRKKSPGDE